MSTNINFFDRLVRGGAPFLELGLSGLDRALTAGGDLIDATLGLPVAAREDAPVNGPQGYDAATSDLANRWTRILLNAPPMMETPSSLPNPPSLREVGPQMLDALRTSLPLDDPKQVALLPLRLPIAVASMTVQESRRALAVAQIVPSERMPDFLEFVFEVFSDLRVYFSLRYQEEIERLQKRLEAQPDDAQARLALGRTFIKCGLFPQAMEELQRAAEAEAVRPRALYERLVAGCRTAAYDEAFADGVRALELEPDNERARYWLWLTSQKTDGYPESVPKSCRMRARDGRHPSPVVLENVTDAMGLDKVSGGRGTAVFDSNGNGLLDLAVAGAHAGVSLFRNNGDGTFTDISIGSGLDRCVYGFAVVAGDYDNNGLVDLYITALGFFDGWGTLMRNNGDGTFTDVTDEAGVRCWGPGFSAAGVDSNGNGLLDLFIANNLGGLFDRKTPNRLFRNNGDGTFTEVAREAGLITPWTTIGAAWGDFTNTGRQDLFVNNQGPAQLFRNNGDGTFKDVSREAGIDEPAIGSVALVADVDDDGWLDIVQLTYSRPEEMIYTLRNGAGPAHGSPLRIWRNNRDGSFTNIAPELGVDGCWGTMSAVMSDFDNDGYQDLFLGNGDPSMDRLEASILLHNQGGAALRNITFSAGLPVTGKGHGVNAADFLGDGRMSLIVAGGGLYPGDLDSTKVFRPAERPGNFLNVRLVGVESNRDAIGARVALKVGDRTQHRQVSGGSNFGCLPFEQHFGLAAATSIEELEVRWPRGKVETFKDLPINATIRIVEGEGTWNRLDLSAAST